MADRFSKEKRSRIMASISATDSKPEIVIRKYLFGLGYRYRKNVKALPGKPDLVLKRFKTTILIHGCFWHGHDNCPAAAKPKSNSDFWIKKIHANKVRDARNLQALEKLGWNIITIWQCHVKNKAAFEQTMRKVAHKLSLQDTRKSEEA
ncbi:MAG: DNA mismatch endonuclease Vsr [Pyrinomonadaceae bacterium]